MRQRRLLKVGRGKEVVFLPFFSISAEELYSILEAWVKVGMVVLPEWKHELTEEEKQGVS